METKEQIASGEIQSEKDFVFYDVYLQKVTRTPKTLSLGLEMVYCIY